MPTELLIVFAIAIIASVYSMILERKRPQDAGIVRLVGLLVLVVIVMALVADLFRETNSVFHVW